MLETITFIVGSVALAYISRASLRNPRSHGFYRFFAWELMLALVVLNMDGWYSAPLTPTQVVCGLLMALSLFLVLMGYLSLSWFGQLDHERNDVPLLGFEKTTEMVTHGIYSYIRHPMYGSLISLDAGLFFKQITWWSGSLALIACLFLVLAMLVEEQENTRYFGTRYQEYMKRTRRIVPFLF